MGKASARKRLHRNNAARSSSGSKGTIGDGIWSRLALILVALMLVATSLGLLAFTVVLTLYDWSRMRQWQPASAQVESVQLHKGGTAREGTCYAAVVRVLNLVIAGVASGAGLLILAMVRTLRSERCGRNQRQAAAKNAT